MTAISLLTGNFIYQNITGTIECPLFHAWTQNLGRHNHGSMYFNDPWSGFFELGAPFWAQAQITQLVEIGWTMLAVGQGSGQLTSGASFVTFVSPDKKDFTIVLVTKQSSGSETVSFAVTPAPKAPLHVWRTSRFEPFKSLGTVSPSAAGLVSVELPPESVVSVSTVSDAAHAEVAVPPRSSFPLPYTASFDDQPIASPGRYLSDVWGSFEVYQHPAKGKVLRQSAVGCPIVWHTRGAPGGCGDEDPFTLLPSGSNWMNYKVSVDAMLDSSAVQQAAAPYVALCGRISIWPLRAELLKGMQGSPPVGVCLVLTQAGAWRLEERDNNAIVALANGTANAPSAWTHLSLAFDGAEVSFGVGGHSGTARTNLMNGVAGFGSGFHHAFFDDFSLQQQAEHALTPGSFLLDVTPMGTQQGRQGEVAGIAQPIVHTRDGWGAHIIQASLLFVAPPSRCDESRVCAQRAWLCHFQTAARRFASIASPATSFSTGSSTPPAPTPHRRRRTHFPLRACRTNRAISSGCSPSAGNRCCQWGRSRRLTWQPARRTRWASAGRPSCRRRWSSLPVSRTLWPHRKGAATVTPR